MAYQFNFGGLTVAGAPPTPAKRRKFRLAVLGDFSARANRGELETGEALSNRKTLKIAADTLDDALERLSPRLQLALPGSGTVELTFSSLEDFHPDALYEKLDIFSTLSGLRSRLKTNSTFAKAAQELRAIGLAPAPAAEPVAPATARGAVLSVDAGLDDFARFLGRPTAVPDESEDTKASLNAFLRGIVAPHVSASKDPQQDKLVAAADTAIGAMMREVLHHPDFQTLESLWRSLAFLATRLDTDESLEIVLIDLSAEEFAADLSAATQLDATALYRLLVEQPQADARAGLYSAIVANYVFERTPAHADLLGRVAIIAAAAQAPFVASVPVHTLNVKPANLDPLVRDAWTAMRALPEAAYVGLGVPRFLLRLPYGQKTEPIESFKFDEYTIQAGPRALLWASPAVAVGLLLAEAFRQQGDGMQLGSVAGVGELPYYTYTDADGDETALPCTEQIITGSIQETISGEGFMPLLALKNSPEMRVGVFKSLGEGLLWGWWAGALPALTAPAAPEAAAAETASEAAAEAAPAPAAAPAEGGTGDADLDALLSSLDAPAAPVAPTEAPADASAEVPADAPAATEPPAADAPAPAAEAADPELEALLAGLNPIEAPTEPAPPPATAEADAALPDAAAPEAAAQPESDPELEAMLAALEPVEAPVEPQKDGEADAPPADAETVAENAVATEQPPEPVAEAEGDPELEAMLASLQPVEAPAEPSAETAPPDNSEPLSPPATEIESDPELAEMLATMSEVSLPAAEAGEAATSENSELPATSEAAPDQAEPPVTLTVEPAEPSLESDPELEAMLASLEPVAAAPAPTEESAGMEPVAESIPADSSEEDSELEAMLAALHPVEAPAEPPDENSSPEADQRAAESPADVAASEATPPPSAQTSPKPPPVAAKDAAPEEEKFLSDFG